MLARASCRTRQGEWRPGLFVRGKVVTDQAEVPVAVKAARSRSCAVDVVFVSVGELFEAARWNSAPDDEWVEITSGLKAGERYVADNSFIVKADLGKAEAAHEH